MHGLGGGRRLARQRASSDPRALMDWDRRTQTGARTSGAEEANSSNGGTSLSPPSGHSAGRKVWPRSVRRADANLHAEQGMPGAGLT